MNEEQKVTNLADGTSVAYSVVQEGRLFHIVEIKFCLSEGTSQPPSIVMTSDDGRAHAQETYKIIVAKSPILGEAQ